MLGIDASVTNITAAELHRKDPMLAPQKLQYQCTTAGIVLLLPIYYYHFFFGCKEVVEFKLTVLLL